MLCGNTNKICAVKLIYKNWKNLLVWNIFPVKCVIFIDFTTVIIGKTVSPGPGQGLVAFLEFAQLSRNCRHSNFHYFEHLRDRQMRIKVRCFIVYSQTLVQKYTNLYLKGEAKLVQFDSRYQRTTQICAVDFSACSVVQPSFMFSRLNEEFPLLM